MIQKEVVSQFEQDLIFQLSNLNKRLHQAEDALRDIDNACSHSSKLLEDVRATLKWYWSLQNK